MTADEIAFAGGTAGYANMSTPYAWFISNSSGRQVSNGWSLSPFRWYGGNASEWLWFPDEATLGGSDVSNTLAVRPAISLKSCVKVKSGNGTAEKPYTIQETENGC